MLPSGYAAFVCWVVAARQEPEAEVDGGVGLVGLAIGGDDREPIINLIPGGDILGGDGGATNDIGPEEVIVLDNEGDGVDAVSEGDIEMFIPLWVLVVAYHPGPSHDRPSYADRHIRVAGDHVLAVVTAVAGPLIAAVSVVDLFRISAGDAGEGGADGGDQAAEVLREQVHVGETPSLDYVDVEVAVEPHLLPPQPIVLGPHD